MKLEFQNRWLRLLIEFLPASPEIRRYRVAPVRLQGELGRLLQRQIAERMQRTTPEAP
jgi:hypothetical protein